jgi:hypothetical protein
MALSARRILERRALKSRLTDHQPDDLSRLRGMPAQEPAQIGRPPLHVL